MARERAGEVPEGEQERSVLTFCTSTRTKLVSQGQGALGREQGPWSKGERIGLESKVFSESE